MRGNSKSQSHVSRKLGRYVIADDGGTMPRCHVSPAIWTFAWRFFFSKIITPHNESLGHLWSSLRACSRWSTSSPDSFQLDRLALRHSCSQASLCPANPPLSAGYGESNQLKIWYLKDLKPFTQNYKWIFNFLYFWRMPFDLAWSGHCW